MLTFTDCTKYASAGSLIHRQQTVNWIFAQTQQSSIYRHKLYCHLLTLVLKDQALLTIRAKLKLAIIFFYFSVQIDSGEILACVWQEEEALLYPNISN